MEQLLNKWRTQTTRFKDSDLSKTRCWATQLKIRLRWWCFSFPLLFYVLLIICYVPQNESIWHDISRKHHQHPQCVQPFQRVFRGLLVFILPCNAICCDRQAKWIPGAFYVPERHWNSTMWNSAKLASMVNFHDRSSFFQPTFEGRQFGESTKASNGGSRIHCLWRWGSKASNIYILGPA